MRFGNSISCFCVTFSLPCSPLVESMRTKKKLWLEKLLLVILDIFNYEKKIALTFNLLPLMYSFWTYCVHSFDLFSLSVKWKRKFHLCIRSNTQINISWKNFFFLPSSRNLFSISCFNYFCKFFKHSRMLLKL